MNRAASGASPVPPSAILAGLDGSTAITIFASLTELPPQTLGSPPEEMTNPAGVAWVASMRHTRGPSPSTQTVSPDDDAASAIRVVGGDPPAPTGSATRLNVVAPSDRHHSSMPPLSRLSAAQSRPCCAPAGGVHSVSVHGSALSPSPVGRSDTADQVAWGPLPLPRSTSPLVVAATKPVPPGCLASRKMPAPSRLVASAVNTGSVSGLVEGPTAWSTPTPGSLSPGVPSMNMGPSPVPTHTSSSFGSS